MIILVHVLKCKYLQKSTTVLVKLQALSMNIHRNDKRQGNTPIDSDEFGGIFAIVCRTVQSGVGRLNNTQTPCYEDTSFHGRNFNLK